MSASECVLERGWPLWCCCFEIVCLFVFVCRLSSSPGGPWGLSENVRGLSFYVREGGRWKEGGGGFFVRVCGMRHSHFKLLSPVGWLMRYVYAYSVLKWPPF